MKWVKVDLHKLHYLNTKHLLGGTYDFPFDLAV